MVTNIIQKSKHQWQSKLENTHRVRFFTTQLEIDEMFTITKADKFHKVADAFKETPQYRWVEENDVTLGWMEDDSYLAWKKQIIIYGDLTEAQYVDYTLRFFKHRTDWK